MADTDLSHLEALYEELMGELPDKAREIIAFYERLRPIYEAALDALGDTTPYYIIETVQTTGTKVLYEEHATDGTKVLYEEHATDG